MSVRPAAVSALSSLRSAAAFFAGHYLVVFAFGVGVSVQRALSVRYGDAWPPAVVVAGEALTTALRLLFLVWVARALLREPGLTRAAGRRLVAFLRQDWRALIGHLLLLTAATLIFNNLLEGVGAALLTEEVRPQFLAWLLAVKNVTVIPFTLIWLVVMVRDALRSVPEPARAAVRSEPDLR